ncbi:3896_t:CDS:1, partial [Dentiscutata erythropus]
RLRLELYTNLDILTSSVNNLFRILSVLVHEQKTLNPIDILIVKL